MGVRHLGCADRDMAERWSQDCRCGECCRKRLGRARRDDPVSTGHHDEGSSAQRLGMHQPAGGPPQAPAGFVIAIPRTPTGACCLIANGTPPVDPVLEGGKTTGVVAFGIEGGEPDEFAFCCKGIEQKDRAWMPSTGTLPTGPQTREVIGSEGPGLNPPILGVKIPGGREHRTIGDFALATQHQREREQAPMQ